MTISATTQGLRMGVATSTSRPTVPFDGQVISETDTDSLKVYNGTSWIGVGGLVLITPTSTANTGGTVTVTGGKVNVAGSSSVSLNGVFTSTYQNYLILIDSLTASVNYVSMYMRLRASGTDTTSSTYYGGSIYGTFAGVTGGGAGNGIAYFNIGNALNTASQMSTIQLFSPQTATLTTYTNVGVSRDAMFNAGGYQSGATSFDGFTIYSSSDNYTCNITVYGYQKS